MRSMPKLDYSALSMVLLDAATESTLCCRVCLEIHTAGCSIVEVLSRHTACSLSPLVLIFVLACTHHLVFFSKKAIEQIFLYNRFLFSGYEISITLKERSQYLCTVSCLCESHRHRDLNICALFHACVSHIDKRRLPDSRNNTRWLWTSVCYLY